MAGSYMKNDLLVGVARADSVEFSQTEENATALKQTHVTDKKKVTEKKHIQKTIVTKAKPGKNGTIIKKCSRCGKKLSSTVINSPKSISLGKIKYIYNGKARKPAVVVKDSKGNIIPKSNYKVKYINNVNAGKATVKIVFRGNKYTGKLTKNFRISKASNKLKYKGSYSVGAKTKEQFININAKAKSGNISYKSDNKYIKVNSAGKVTIAKNYTGIGIITITAKGKNYKKLTRKIKVIVNPMSTTIKPLENTSEKKLDKGKIVVKWNKVLYVDGYQLQYSLDPTFKKSNKTVNVYGESCNNTVISNLNKNKKYYIRIRTFKNISGKNHYSKWSGKKVIDTEVMNSFFGPEYIWPCPNNYKINSPYGPRARNFHRGVDIGANRGDSIVAARAGRVVKSCYHGQFGNYIMIDHGEDYYTLYAHASTLLVREGSYVKQGQLIARVGATGRATGNHLHFGVFKGEQHLNPMEFINKNN